MMKTPNTYRPHPESFLKFKIYPQIKKKKTKKNTWKSISSSDVNIFQRHTRHTVISGLHSRSEKSGPDAPTCSLQFISLFIWAGTPHRAVKYQMLQIRRWIKYDYCSPLLPTPISKDQLVQKAGKSDVQLMWGSKCNTATWSTLPKWRRWFTFRGTPKTSPEDVMFNKALEGWGVGRAGYNAIPGRNNLCEAMEATQSSARSRNGEHGWGWGTGRRKQSRGGRVGSGSFYTILRRNGL